MKKTMKRLVVVGLAGTAALMLFGANGFAYIDPSVMTYVIQAAAGIVIALGAFFTIYFRRAKKKVSEKLGIDENRNKEKESDDIMMTEESEKSDNVTE